MSSPEIEKGQKELEKRLYAEYKKAYKEMVAKFNKFAKRFKQEDSEARKAMSAKEYKEWRKKKISDEHWMQEMIEQLSESLTDADKKSVDMIKDDLPHEFAQGRDFGAYQVEKSGGIDTSFTLTDEDAVKAGLYGDYYQPNLDISKDKRWNKKQISSAITQGILQGESMDDVAKRLRKVTNMSIGASIRNARTWTGSAQEQGKDNAYHRAKDMGCDLENIWISTIDMRTRHSHRLMNGERKELDAKFSNGLRYPCDMEANKPSEVYNCRCGMQAVVKGIPFDMSDRKMDIGDMTYDEWRKGKDLVKNNETNKAVNGVDITKTYIPALEHLGEVFEGKSFIIDDILRQQGYDGLPEVLDADAFRKKCEKIGFIGARGIGKRMTPYDIIDAQIMELFHGKFYVNCQHGGSAYGKGMYTFGNFSSGKLSAEQEHGIKLYGKRHVRYTVSDDFRWADFDDLYSEYFIDGKADIIENAIRLRVKKDVIKNMRLNGNEEKYYRARYLDDETRMDVDKVVKWYQRLSDAEQKNLDNKILNREPKGIRRYLSRDEHLHLDVGEIASLLGYDGIRVKRNGYAIVLNRTKIKFSKDTK